MRCFRCGREFEDPELTREYRGEYWGQPAYETVYVCPFCGSDEIGEEEEEQEYDDEEDLD